MPIIVLPLVSKLRVVTIGSPVRRAPSIAASVSSAEDIVSIHRMSAPPRPSAAACSANDSRASAADSGPSGSRISPVGPMLPPTSTRRPARSASVRASPAAASFSSATRPSALCSFKRCRVPPKLFVRTMSAPASMKPRCSSRIRCGCSVFQSSGASPLVNPRSNRLLPIAPSASSHGRCASSGVNRSVGIVGPAPYLCGCFLELLLHFATKLQRMRNLMEWLGGAARSNHRNASIAQHPADHGLADLDRLNLAQQHLDRLTAHEALLDYDTARGNGHLRRVSTHHARDESHDAACQERGRAALCKMFAGITQARMIEETAQQCT